MIKSPFALEKWPLGNQTPPVNADGLFPKRGVVAFRSIPAGDNGRDDKKLVDGRPRVRDCNEMLVLRQKP